MAKSKRVQLMLEASIEELLYEKYPLLKPLGINHLVRFIINKDLATPLEDDKMLQPSKVNNSGIDQNLTESSFENEAVVLEHDVTKETIVNDSNEDNEHTQKLPTEELSISEPNTIDDQQLGDFASNGFLGEFDSDEIG